MRYVCGTAANCTKLIFILLYSWRLLKLSIKYLVELFITQWGCQMLHISCLYLLNNSTWHPHTMYSSLSHLVVTVEFLECQTVFMCNLSSSGMYKISLRRCGNRKYQNISYYWLGINSEKIYQNILTYSMAQEHLKSFDRPLMRVSLSNPILVILIFY